MKIIPYFKKKNMNEIKASDIRAWQNALMKKGYSETYLKTVNNQLSAIFNYAVRYYDLKDNPCRKAGSIGKSHAGEKEFWTKQEFKQFLVTVENKPETKMAFLLLYWTGMRIGELLALTYNDIDLEKLHAYDEDVKWQLAEPGALMSAKAYQDKKALPLVEKLKEVVKNLTIKCVQLTEQGRKLTAKVDGQQVQISRLTDKVMEQSGTIDRLQEKASDLERLERHLGREQVQLIVERSKALEQAERANKCPKRAFEMSR